MIIRETRPGTRGKERTKKRKNQNVFLMKDRSKLISLGERFLRHDFQQIAPFLLYSSRVRRLENWDLDYLNNQFLKVNQWIAKPLRGENEGREGVQYRPRNHSNVTWGILLDSLLVVVVLSQVVFCLCSFWLEDIMNLSLVVSVNP